MYVHRNTDRHTIVWNFQSVAATSGKHARPDELEPSCCVGVAVLIGEGRDGVLHVTLVLVLVEVELGPCIGAEGGQAHLGGVRSDVEVLHHVVDVLLHLKWAKSVIITLG